MQLTDIEKSIVRKHVEYAKMSISARFNRIQIELGVQPEKITKTIAYAKMTGLYAEQMALMNKEAKKIKRR